MNTPFLPSGPRRICAWCDPAHDLGPAPDGCYGNTHTMCDDARVRLLHELHKIPVAACHHGLGPNDFCIDCEAQNANRSRGA